MIDEPAEKRRALGFDVPLLTVTVVICGLGYALLCSATGWSGAEADASRQAMYLLVGLGWTFSLSLVPPRFWRPLIPALYCLSLITLAVVMIPGVGQSAKGAQRWLSLGPLGVFQPSETAKLAVILALAWMLSAWAERRKQEQPAKSFAIFLLGLAVLGLPGLLIVLQPDLGTAICLVVVGLAMLFVAGASPVWLAALGTTGALVLPNILKEYQRDRLLIYLNPEFDPMGMGYSLIQSKTALGSGGLFGKGYGAGHMTQHGFVPENWTDFIFTVMGEEFGYFGCLGFLALYGLLVLLVIRAGWRSEQLFCSLVAAGVATLLSFSVLINVGMTCGLAPVVGLPLPLASYGGSALLTNLTGIGLVAACWRARRPSADDEQPLEDL